MSAELVTGVTGAVEALRPGDDREARSRRRILAELARLPAPFEQRSHPTHITASAIVAGPRGTLLHRHKRLGIWMQPGGHVEPQEAPEDAAVRETAEETGLKLRHPGGRPRLLHVDVHPASRGHIHLDLRYLLLAGDEEPAPPPGESPDVRWFSWDQAIAAADAALVGALLRARELAGSREASETLQAVWR